MSFDLKNLLRRPYAPRGDLQVEKGTAVSGEATAKVHSGTVKWFNPEKGRGFIGQKGGPDVLVFVDDIKGFKPAWSPWSPQVQLKEGQNVKFELKKGELRAVNVEIVK